MGLNELYQPAELQFLGVKTPMDAKGISLPPPSRPFFSESPRRPFGDFRSGGTPTRRRLPGRVERESQDASGLSFRIRPAFPQGDFGGRVGSISAGRA